MSEAMKWQGMDTAPKEGMILLDLGYSYAVIGLWNEFEGAFVYAGMHLNNDGGKWNDPYFKTHYATVAKAKAWMP